jgi:hypothetical protein
LSLVGQLSQIPFFANQDNRASGALEGLEGVDVGAAFGLLLAVMTVSLWSYWAAGLLLSGSGGTEVFEALIKVVLSAFGIVLWPVLFREGVDGVNALTATILTAPVVHNSLMGFDAKLGGTVLVAGSAVAGAIAKLGVLHSLGKAAGFAGGLTIASLLGGGDPVGWFLDLLITLVLMLGTLIIEIERIALYATVTFAYVAGPIAVALTGFKGFRPLTEAFFRITLAAAATVVVWTLLYVMMAIFDSTIDPSSYSIGAWWSTIVNNLTAVVMVVLVVFTPGVVRRHMGGTGGGATGALRTAAIVGGYGRMRRGGSTKRASGSSKSLWRQRMRGPGPSSLPTAGPAPGPTRVPSTGAGRRRGGPTGVPGTVPAGTGPSGLPSTGANGPGGRPWTNSRGPTKRPRTKQGAGPNGLPTTAGAGGPTERPSVRPVHPGAKTKVGSGWVKPGPTGLPNTAGAAGGPNGPSHTGGATSGPNGPSHAGGAAGSQPVGGSSSGQGRATLRHDGGGGFSPDGPGIVDTVEGSDGVFAVPERALPPAPVPQSSESHPPADSEGSE